MSNKIVAFVIGCEHSKGIAKGSNKPYDFAEVNYLGKNDGWTQSAQGQCTRVGLEQKKVRMCNTNPNLMAEFQKLEGQFPMECELILDIDPDNLQRNWVVDIKPMAK